jgi:hypothetical protein
MFNHIENRMLLGRKVSLSIGEPWDFASKDGEGILKGEIVGLYAPPECAIVLLLATSTFDADNHKISQVICAGRYERGWSLNKEIASGMPTGCQIYYNKFGNYIFEDEISKVQLAYGEWENFMIGSIKLD